MYPSLTILNPPSSLPLSKLPYHPLCNVFSLPVTLWGSSHTVLRKRNQSQFWESWIARRRHLQTSHVTGRTRPDAQKINSDVTPDSLRIGRRPDSTRVGRTEGYLSLRVSRGIIDGPVESTSASNWKCEPWGKWTRSRPKDVTKHPLPRHQSMDPGKIPKFSKPHNSLTLSVPNQGRSLLSRTETLFAGPRFETLFCFRRSLPLRLPVTLVLTETFLLNLTFFFFEFLSSPGNPESL